VTSARTIVATVRADPVEFGWRAASRVAPGAFWRRYRGLCERSVSGPRFLLSFDCDTDRDFAVVEAVHDRVVAAGARPAYAVPGELLERGIDHYRALHDAGATFMNHGYVEHSVFDATSSTYRSVLDYDDIARGDVARDVTLGHEALRDLLGIEARGFRTPHFGSFQDPVQLSFLHGVLASLGYRWSSSTTPRCAVSRGPVFHDFGLWEVPVTGSRTRPLSILDSYSFRFTVGGRGMSAFEEEAAMLAAELDRGGPFVVNLYADPSQVEDWPGFFDAVARLARWAVSFDELVDEATAR
jgi:hypothetical protein